MNEKEHLAKNGLTLATTKHFGNLDIQVYENRELSHNRAQDDFYMTREQVGQALEYGDPDKAIRNLHARNKERLDPLSTSLVLRRVEGKAMKERSILCYNLRGVMEICRFSTQPKANAFMDFCWDVVTALMRGETVSLMSHKQAELDAAAARRQANFELMSTGLKDIQENQQLLYAQFEDLSKYRAEDRQAIENVLSYDRTLIGQANRLIEKVEMVLRGIQQLKPSDPNAEPVKFARYQAPVSETSWFHDVRKMIGAISKAKHTPYNCVSGAFNNVLKTEYGFSVYEERKIYAKEHGIDDVQSIPLGVVVENDKTMSAIYYNRVADMYEEITGKKVKRMKEAGFVEQNVEPFPLVLSPENPGGEPLNHKVDPAPEVVAEAHAVEIETPAEAAKRIAKKKYYKPSVFVPIVEPVAKKRGDTSYRYQATYKAVYEIVGVDMMRRLEKTYIKKHGREPKPRTEMFKQSDRAMNIFKEAVHKLEAVS